MRHRTRTLVTLVVWAAFVLWMATRAGAQQPPPLPIQDGQVIPLWSGAAPGALGTDEADIPTLTVFLPRTMAPNTPVVR
jgi:hypothetical protein